MLLILFLLGQFPEKIIIERDMMILAEAEDRIFCHDSRAIKNGLWVIDTQGIAIIKTGHKGSGPGEYQKISAASYYLEKLYVIDYRRRVLSVYDKNLKFINEHALTMSPKDILVCAAGVYIVGFNPKNDTMVTKFDHDFSLISTFAGAITAKNSDLLGYQSGKIFQYQDHLYFSHGYQPNLMEYSLDGTQEKKIPIPGHGNLSFFQEGLKNQPPQKLGQIASLTYLDNTIYIFIKFEETSSSFLFDMKTKRWSKPKESFPGIKIGNGLYYRAGNDTEDAFVAAGVVKKWNTP